MTQNKQTTVIDVGGMHCRACELLLEKQLGTLAGVLVVKASTKAGKIVIIHDSSFSLAQARKYILKEGYTLTQGERLPLLATDKKLWRQLGVGVVAAGLLYLLIRALKLDTLGALVGDDYGSWLVVLLMGLVAGVSTCMALVGGLVFSLAAKYAQAHPVATTQQKFVPHLMFNLGRIVGFALMGAVVGYLGLFINFSWTITGWLTIFIALVMGLVGLQLIGIFPRLSRWQFTLPKSLAVRLGLNKKNQAAYSHRGTIVLGALTFFLPCGFTQAMQLYALSTGSPLAGAVTMGVFALGTAPGLLGIGGLTAFVKGKLAPYFFKFVGVVVIWLALFNLNTGLNQAGLMPQMSLDSCVDALSGICPLPGTNNSLAPAAVPSSEVQVLAATFNRSQLLQPQSFTVNVNQPVRLEIDVQQTGGGCTRGLMIPSIFGRQVWDLNEGEDVVIEFTPSKTGSIKLACNMQMITYATIKVV